MNEILLSAKIIVFQHNELNQIEKSLFDKALSASERAYCPYSHFKVGCAVLLDNGEIITGSNQENAAYTAGNCAERVSLNYALSTYPSATVKAIMVVAQNKEGITSEVCTPCGECRQVLKEIEGRTKQPIDIYMVGREKIYKVTGIDVLLPLGFAPIFLSP